MKQLPTELWGLVLGRLEQISDFAHAQLVSKTFCTLVLQRCWGKARGIRIRSSVKKVTFKTLIQRNETKLVEFDYDWVEMSISTGVPWQTRLLPIREAAPILENLVQKASKKTMNIELGLSWLKEERHNQVLRHFFEALIAAETKVQKFKFSGLDAVSSQRTTSQALARFLKSNAESLVNLEVSLWFIEEPVPLQLVEAFQACRSLEIVKIRSFDAYPVLESILKMKPHLKSLALDCFCGGSAAASGLLGLESSLQSFSTSTSFLEPYFEMVKRLNLGPTHPLYSLRQLRVESNEMTSLPWALLPNLEHLIVDLFYYNENLAGFVCSFLMHWKDSAEERKLDFQIKKCATKNESNTFPNDVDRMKMAAAVVQVAGCYFAITETRVGHLERTYDFQKGNAKLLIHF